MSMPFYVPPEQLVKDKADFARKGIARGRALIAMRYDGGIVLVAENASNTLRKISEIYDRIAFAGVGKYNEFDSLRQAGIRAADLTGYQFSRRDVDGRSLANQYGQIIGQAFTHESKPLEVEILIAEVGITAESDCMYHISFDGTVSDEKAFCVLGGDDASITARLQESTASESTLKSSIQRAAIALAGPDRTLTADDLEVAILSRTSQRRCFSRVTDADISEMLS
ncbi:MAG: 20S proteasome alpha-type subunit [actinobacterium acAcidi]|nr:MAG: 20S proteasome alpha-type subunit [actinobacterium acAcidi]